MKKKTYLSPNMEVLKVRQTLLYDSSGQSGINAGGNGSGNSGSVSGPSGAKESELDIDFTNWDK